MKTPEKVLKEVFGESNYWLMMSDEEFDLIIKAMKNHAGQFFVAQFEQNQWIPVSERLPERVKGTLCSKNVWVFNGVNSEKDFYDYRLERWSRYPAVTHWRYEPDPPK